MWNTVGGTSTTKSSAILSDQKKQANKKKTYFQTFSSVTTKTWSGSSFVSSLCRTVFRSEPKKSGTAISSKQSWLSQKKKKMENVFLICLKSSFTRNTLSWRCCHDEYAWLKKNEKNRWVFKASQEGILVFSLLPSKIVQKSRLFSTCFTICRFKPIFLVQLPKYEPSKTMEKNSLERPTLSR